MTRFLNAKYQDAEALSGRAISVAERLPERDDIDLAVIYSNHGDALSKIDAARAALQWALRDYDAHEPRDRPAVLEARERWGRFLIEHPRGAEDDAAAHEALHRVLADAQAAARYTAAARAHADLAQLALHRGDAAAAVDEVDIAARALREIQSDYDVRIDDELLLIKSEALAAPRRLPEARPRRNRHWRRHCAMTPLRARVCDAPARR